jgi:hypothetical protein
MSSLYILLSLIITATTIIGYKQNRQLNLSWPTIANLCTTALIGPFLVIYFFMRYRQETRYSKKINLPNFMFSNCQFFKLKTSSKAKKVYDFKPKKKYDFTKKH